jgi:SAM-dependent methyltransferase
MDESLYHQFFDVEKRHWWFAARQDIILAYVRDAIKLRADARILDVGCGTGAILEAFSRNHPAFGFDFSETAVAYCKKRGLDNVFSGSLADLASHGPFELITYFDVIEHTDDDDGILRQGLNLLKPGGHLLVTVPAYQWLWSNHDVLNHHKRRYTRGQLRRVVETAGFTVACCTYLNTLLFPAAVIVRYWANVTGKNYDHLAIPPPLLNILLKYVFRIEGSLIPLVTLPFGLSILCHGRKPGAA